MSRIFLNLSMWLALLVMPVVGMAQAPDQILFNAQVLTVDEDFSIASAIAISGERILAVGSDQEILALANAQTEQTDLMGRTVIPGLIDNHLHYLRGLQCEMQEND